MSVRETGAAISAGFLIWAAVIVVILVTSGIFLFFGRPFAKYSAETDRQVYQQSIQYQEGMQQDLARYCYEMKTKPDSATALKGMIREKAQVYHGPVSSDLQSCFNEAGAVQQ
jgi:hypothetical protein